MSYAEDFLKWMVLTGKAKIEVAKSITLEDIDLPEETPVKMESAAASEESVEGKDLKGSGIELEGDIPDTTGKMIRAEKVYDHRRLDKDVFVLKYDKKTNTYVKVRRKMV